MNKISLVIGSVFMFAFLANAQVNQPPKLMVAIVIDQMREEFLWRYYGQYSEDGFKRLVNNGFICRNVQYNYTPTITAVGHASIFTGTTPRYHGIIGNSWYDRKLGRVIYCVNDSLVKSVGNPNAEQSVSPHNLLSTNISDELKIATNKQAKVITISTKDRTAVLMGGHMADGAFWLDLNTGNYISSTYYMNSLPGWLTKFNSERRAFKYLETVWQPLLPDEAYNCSMADDNNYEEILIGKERPTFPYNLKELADKNSPYFEVLNRSPFSNSLLVDLAEQVLINTRIGQGEVTDLLAISFSATDPVGHTYGPLSKEVNDTYLRLDLDLARLLKLLDKYVGEGNYSLFLTADHGVGENPYYLMDNRIAAGDMNEDSLYKSATQYLEKKLGPGQWIVTMRNDQFYLNHQLIEEKKLFLPEIEQLLANFILQQDGIAEVYTAEQLMHNEYTKYYASKLQNGFNFKLSGDVRYLMQPGWYANMHPGATHNTAYNYDSHVPLIFFGKGFNKGVSYDYHEITDIIPTISTLLRIKFPSAATGKPIPEVFAK